MKISNEAFYSDSRSKGVSVLKKKEKQFREARGFELEDDGPSVWFTTFADILTIFAI